MLKLSDVVNITGPQILPLTGNPWESESKPAGISIASLNSSEGNFQYYRRLNFMYVT
jgi:hypothetical protein